MDVLGLQNTEPDFFGVRNSHQNSSLEQFGISSQQSITDDRAPILSDQMAGFALTNDLCELRQLMNQRRLVIKTIRRNLCGWIALEVGRYHPVSLRTQRFDLVTPSQSVVRKTMQQNHSRTGALLYISKFQGAHLNELRIVMLHIQHPNGSRLVWRLGMTENFHRTRITHAKPHGRQNKGQHHHEQGSA